MQQRFTGLLLGMAGLILEERLEQLGLYSRKGDLTETYKSQRR